MLTTGYTLINIFKNQQKSAQAIVMKKKEIFSRIDDVIRNELGNSQR